MQKLRILYSAYACEPGKGSEPGIGWHWAVETAHLGHEVWVITRANNQACIEAARMRGEVPANLHFVFYDLPRWAAWWKRGGRGVRLYYVLWQWAAWRVARALHALHPFDAVHHITFGVMRHPIFMNRLGIPCVVGPVGGGERAPLALRRHFPPRVYCEEMLRDAVNWLARLDPWLRRGYRQAALVLAKTPDTLRWLRPYRARAECMLELGVDKVDEPAPAAADEPGRLRLLFVGRFIPFKGMGLGLRALAAMRAQGVDASLTLIGGGPQGGHWRALAARLGIEPYVTWRAPMPQQEVLRAYREFDALLFPSLHDSSGNVVLEALASGLPVICLDLGGPAQLVDASCGRVVAVDRLGEEQVVQGLAAAAAALAADRPQLRALRAGALARARRFRWSDVVARVWGADGRGYRLISEAAPGHPRRAVLAAT